MEKIKIPDDFYIDEYVLAHKSCIVISVRSSYSNDRYVIPRGEVKQSHTDMLRYICNMYDILNEKTYFEENKYKNMYINIYDIDLLELWNNSTIIFNGINELIEYLAKNYPECIRNDDIKIALK
jgi:hypothetical protein